MFHPSGGWTNISYRMEAEQLWWTRLITFEKKTYTYTCRGRNKPKKDSLPVYRIGIGAPTVLERESQQTVVSREERTGAYIR